MANIVVLDEFTANQIAAGEVVERPVSVVKELIENSLDAGATRITVELIQGGLVSIRVVDNGSGMSAEDAELCFLRHATSKIKIANDLNNILTLGFRGEALPSIASVARVTLTTRNNENLAGTVINIEAGRAIGKSSTGCPIGTTIEVRDIFFNTPARRKFIKSANAETGQVSDLISRIALARPDVRFELRSGNKVLFLSPGNGSQRDVAGVVFGLDNVKSMLEIKHRGELLEVDGLVSKPVLTRASRQYQNVFINGRYIRSNLISTVLQQAYHTLIPAGRFPIAVLHFTIDPTQIDVNVHPTKMEIRFAKEQEIHQELLGALERSLNRPTAITGLWEGVPSKQAIPTVTMETNAPSEKREVAKENNVTKDQESTNVSSFKANSYNQKKDQLKFYLPLEQTEPRITPDTNIDLINTVMQINPVKNVSDQFLECNNSYETESVFLSLVPVGQVPPTYVLAYGDKGLFIIDQHAAHERVLYEKYLKMLDDNMQSQILLHPITLDIPNHEANVLIRNIVEFNKIGYILEHFGGDTFLLRGVPTNTEEEPAEVFLDLLARLQDNPTKQFERGLIIDHLAAALACRDAVKAGKHVGHLETKALLEDLGHCKSPYTCPHGRPTLIQISHEEMKKRFKR